MDAKLAARASLLDSLREDLFAELTDLQDSLSSRKINPPKAQATMRTLDRLETRFQEIKTSIFSFNADVEEDSEKLSISSFAAFNVLRKNASKLRPLAKGPQSIKFLPLLLLFKLRVCRF